MAVRLSIAFGTTSESRLNQQTQYDLWHAERRRNRLEVMKLAPAWNSARQSCNGTRRVGSLERAGETVTLVLQLEPGG